MAELKKLQENGVDIYPVTLEDVVFDSNGNTLPNKYQTKEDSTLNTTDKTIVGAINELFQYGTNAKQNLVDTLVAKGISASTSMTFDELINLINDLGGGDSNNLPSWYKKAWIEAKPLPIATYGVAVTSVGNKIYAMNARTGNTTLANTNYCYNVETNTWEEKATIPTARIYAGASAIGDKIYCIGGYALSNFSYANECYDTTTDTWSTKTNMSLSRTSLSSGVVNNKIYCIGGANRYNNYYFATNECYDVSSDTWESKEDMPISESNLGITCVNNMIFCIGGTNSSAIYLDTNYCYIIENDN